MRKPSPAGRPRFSASSARKACSAACRVRHASDGFHPGGTNHSPTRSDTISRAGAKIAGSPPLSSAQKNPASRRQPLAGTRCQPGRDDRRATGEGIPGDSSGPRPLDKRLTGAPGLQAAVADAATFSPKVRAAYDAILSDLNGDACEAIAHVIRLVEFLTRSCLVVFTLKTPGVATYQELNALESSVLNSAAASGLRCSPAPISPTTATSSLCFLNTNRSPRPAENAL